MLRENHIANQFMLTIQQYKKHFVCGVLVYTKDLDRIIYHYRSFKLLFEFQ